MMTSDVFLSVFSVPSVSVLLAIQAYIVESPNAGLMNGISLKMDIIYFYFGKDLM